MHVLMINGSPHQWGCTWRALSEVALGLQEGGVDSEILWLGDGAMAGCTDCGYCRPAGQCVFDDLVNEVSAQAAREDGFVFGAPVYFSGVPGSMTSFMDRLFFSRGSGDADPFALKPAACVVSARRAGTTAALDQFQKYLTIAEMPVVSSRYWPMVHGNTPAEVEQDLEGLQVMRVLGRNMAWMLANIAAGRAAGVPRPKQERRLGTNFVR
ncbi:MAG: flavodoxin family protein [Anaerolineae bacterium]|jgi:multimeric flavodoxin WrbA|nr:flavodoxin family protein [Chloroflexota bacterium]